MIDREPQLNSELQYAVEVYAKSNEAIRQAQAIIAPATLPLPGEVRAADAGLILDSDQEKALRSAASELGFGRYENRTLSDIGCQGAVVVIEGGQPHKIAAELAVLMSDPATQDDRPAYILLAASPYRVIGANEVVSAQNIGLDATNGDTEYDIVQRVIAKTIGFEPEPPEALAYSYDINDEFKIKPQDETTASPETFVAVGRINEVKVLLMKIEREQHEDGTYCKQPDSAATMAIVSQLADSLNVDARTPVVMVTSATYQASRQVDAVRAGLQTGRKCGIASYGTAQLAIIKGEASPNPAPINQLPAELGKVKVQVQKLESLLKLA